MSSLVEQWSSEVEVRSQEATNLLSLSSFLPHRRRRQLTPRSTALVSTAHSFSL